MTDDLNVGDNKQEGSITGQVGQSPLEQSVGSSTNNQIKTEKPALSEEKPATPPASAESLKPLQPTELPSTEPVTVGSGLPSSPTDTNLPPGINTSGGPGIPKPEPAETITPPSVVPGATSQSNVLQEKSADVTGQEQVMSKDPAILDAIKNEPTPKPAATPSESAQPKQDLGEPTKAPDTDEFLKSILDDKTGIPEGSTPEPSTPTESISPASAEQPPEPKQSVATSQEISDELNLIDDSGSQGTSEQPSVESAPINLSNKPPIDGEGPNAMPLKSSGGVDLDSISGAEPPNAESDEMIKQAGQPKPKPSPLKIILAIFLAIVVVIIGYFVYTALFPVQDYASDTDIETLSQDIDYTTGLDSPEVYATDDEQRKADLLTIQEALLNYYAGEGQFPVAEDLTLLSSGNILETELVPTFITILPTDPSVSKTYGYQSDGTTFTLTTILDDITDSEAVVKDGQAIYSVVYDSSSISTKSSTTATVNGTAIKSTPTSNSDLGL